MATKTYTVDERITKITGVDAITEIDTIRNLERYVGFMVYAQNDGRYYRFAFVTKLAIKLVNKIAKEYGADTMVSHQHGNWCTTIQAHRDVSGKERLVSGVCAGTYDAENGNFELSILYATAKFIADYHNERVVIDSAVYYDTRVLLALQTQVY